MIGRAPHERGQSRHPVADLKPQALGEEPLRRLLIQRADHHMPEPARLNPGCPLDRRRLAVRPVGRPGPFVGSCLAAASVIRGLTCTLT